jgi:redox-sensitive bicupin YhaK (pirin superfamily)
MIRRVSAEERYNSKIDWLDTFHLFSFADYYDPENMNFGALRVFNDDTIAGESGFGAHSHRDMEIVTIMLEGELTHKDDMGNEATMKKGEVQYMSAGTGVTHSEVNLAKEKTHLYQIWIMPKQRNLKPNYDQKDFSDSPKNELVPVASDKEMGHAIHMQADATIYRATLEKEKTLQYDIEDNRGVFIYLTEGELEINGTKLEKGDQARIENEKSLIISAHEDSQFVMIDVILRP